MATNLSLGAGLGGSAGSGYVTTFEKHVRFLAQQEGSRLRAYVQERGLASAKHNWERIGVVQAITKAGRSQATPTTTSPQWSRRISVPTVKHMADTLEPEDFQQMILDPGSAVTREFAMAMGRAVDDIIIAAATGNSLDGEGAARVFATDAPNQTVVAGGGVTLDITGKVLQQFLLNDIDAGVEKVLVITPRQARYLVSIIQATSRDYVEAKFLESTGVVKHWMGFDWLVSTRLTGGTTVLANCLAMTSRAVGLMVEKDIWAQMAQDPTLSFAWRIYTAMTMGATRVEDEHIVSLNVIDNAA